MKKLVLFAYILFFTALVFSQQQANLTLYEWNRIAYNPAFCGTSNTTDITVLTRQQWAGFENAPKNQYVSAHSLLKGGVGIGGVIYNNVSGPTRQTGIKAAFAKHIKINSELNLSMALSLDIYQNFYDRGKLNTGLPGDPAVDLSPLEQKLAPDASFGAVLYADNFFVALSSTNLTQSRYDFLSSEPDFSNPIDRSYYLNGSYSHFFNKDFRYTPGLLIKKTIGLPLEIDFTNRVYYKFFMGGLSYRSSNEASLLFGMQIAENYEFALAYDYSFNPLGSYSSGSYELLLRFKIFNYNRNNGRGRSRNTSLPWS
ncbi:MAG: PorP/SprF family type IX secretion system membrane protein [Bacteroidales bacterium]|jgi:type IX secretion system PorP/SprF family membrane protein|nr:PorP/SprF family type IX secretion system membrane protein [Bacteroidales bacterium]